MVVSNESFKEQEANTKPMRSSCHTVQFYDDEETAMSTAAQFLVGKDPIIVIATAQHGRMIEEELIARGLDAQQARAEGRYLLLDAHETLKRLMNTNMPDRERFAQAIGTAIRQASARSASGKVQAYGEMVALLCGQGNPEAALALERLWNELGKTVQFSLFCNYPMSVIEGTSNAIISRIYAEHTGVITPESLKCVTCSCN